MLEPESPAFLTLGVILVPLWGALAKLMEGTSERVRRR